MTTKQPLVSVIMPAYNAEKTIADSIESIMQQTYINWELLVINDGSKDNTSKIVKSFNDDRIILIEQVNGGVANARNNGIKNSKGAYVAFLDSDDLWMSNKLEKQLNILLSTDYKMVYSKTLCFDGEPRLTSDCMVHLSLDFADKDKILIYDFIPILTVIIEKKALDEIGYFDECLKGTEDWDMWIRVLQKNEAYFINDFLANYKVSATGLSGNLEKHSIEEEKVWQKHIALYNDDTNMLRQWFSDKKQFIIAKRNKQYLRGVKYFAKLLKKPSVLIAFALLRCRR